MPSSLCYHKQMNTKHKIQIETSSPAETEQVGYALGQALGPGMLVTLSGRLGAGKTAFTRGLARGLGIGDAITSPTFTLSNIYGPGERGLTLVHNDVYRLSDGEEFVAAGLAESLETKAVTVIEWAELVDEVLPVPDVAVQLERLEAVEGAGSMPAALPEGPVILEADDVVRLITLEIRDAEVAAWVRAAVKEGVRHD